MKLLLITALLIPFVAAALLSLKFKTLLVRTVFSSLAPAFLFFSVSFSIADSILKSVNPAALASIPHQSALQNAAGIGLCAAVFGAILGVTAHFLTLRNR